MSNDKVFDNDPWALVARSLGQDLQAVKSDTALCGQVGDGHLRESIGESIQQFYRNLPRSSTQWAPGSLWP
jgi:hypothetical protein